MPYSVKERCTARYTATLTDETGAAIPLADLTTLTLTQYVKARPTQIVNSRNAQDVKNANNVTVHATSGLVTWTMQPADNAIVITGSTTEIHVALFRWTWNAGAKEGYHEAEFEVTDQAKVS